MLTVAILRIVVRAEMPLPVIVIPTANCGSAVLRVSIRVSLVLSVSADTVAEMLVRPAKLKVD